MDDGVKTPNLDTFTSCDRGDGDKIIRDERISVKTQHLIDLDTGHR